MDMNDRHSRISLNLYNKLSKVYSEDVDEIMQQYGTEICPEFMGLNYG